MEIKTDYLVIGSGVAGLFFALKAAQRSKVALITKKKEAESNTNRAQGGIASVLDPADSFKLHIKDTLEAGGGLCDKDAVEAVVKEGPNMVRRLIRWGVKFTKKKGRLSLGREGGHSKHRIVHAGDLTGAEIERALLERANSNENIRIYENHISVKLIIAKDQGDNPRCWGAYVLKSRNGEIINFLSKVTMLATGGVGRVYLHTTNPEIATGDGVAMAYRAGAELANLEFIQFHPTSLYHPRGNSFLISEAVRGYGGILRKKNGEAFMRKYHPMKDLAPRDIVTRAIKRELEKTGDECVYLDVTHLNPEEVQKRFPNIYQRCKDLGIDMTRDWVPVVPAAHYACGGVKTDLWGRTTITALYASGEVACTGTHGANRLASNSLLEALVFSQRAYKDSISLLNEKLDFPKIPQWEHKGLSEVQRLAYPEWRFKIQKVMEDNVGIVRSDAKLKKALEVVGYIAKRVEYAYRTSKLSLDLIELRNIATIAELIIRSALERKESRGLHFNLDYPYKDDKNWLKNTLLRRKVPSFKEVNSNRSVGHNRYA